MPKATDSPTTIRMSSLERAHGALIAQLANARPIRIRGAADLADVENVVDHLQDVYHAVVSYLDAVVTDTTLSSGSVGMLATKTSLLSFSASSDTPPDSSVTIWDDQTFSNNVRGYSCKTSSMPSLNANLN